MKALKGGIKLEGKKEATTMPWTIARPWAPKRVRIPLCGSVPVSLRSLVKEGERVMRGQKIAEPKDENSTAAHASLSGKVNQIASFPHPLFENFEAIEILSDGKDEPAQGAGQERAGWESLEPHRIVEILRDLGVTSLLPILTHSIDTLIVNGCESEPYLTSEYCLMMSHPSEILKGAEILRRALGAKDVILAVEDNKEDAAELFKSKIFLARSNVRVKMPPARYPQGNEKILIREILGRRIHHGDHPAKSEVVVFDIATAHAAFEAVVLQKPFYETVITIGGECVVQPQNFWLRAGTLVEDAIKYSKGFLRKPAKTILGGPMSGTELLTLDVPVLKRSAAILGLPPEVAKPESIEPCIRCGLCVDNCPTYISPVMITLAAEKDLFDVAQEYDARLCIECGNCSYVCPSKRPMVELIQYANANS